MTRLRYGPEQDFDDTINRFDPEFWQVDMALQVMGALVTNGSDGLDLYATFTQNDDAIGLYWHAVSSRLHALFRYQVDRNLHDCVLTFDYQIYGSVRGMGTVNGPSLNIVNTGGATFIVDLANYMDTGSDEWSGSITLAFDDVKAGVDANEDVPFHNVESLFIYFVPDWYAGSLISAEETIENGETSIDVFVPSGRLIEAGDTISFRGAGNSDLEVSSSGKTSGKPSLHWQTVVLSTGVSTTDGLPSGTKAILTVAGDPTILPHQEAKIELRNIAVTGGNTTLGRRSTALDAHDIRMTDGYDNSYAQTPKRIVDGMVELGYQSLYNEYGGISHLHRLVHDDTHGDLLAAGNHGGYANDVTYSSDVNDATWTKTNCSVTSTSVSDPIGGSGAQRVTAAAGSAAHHVKKPVTVLASVKRWHAQHISNHAGATYVRLLVKTATITRWVTIDTGTGRILGTYDTSGGADSLVPLDDFFVMPVADGWWRIGIAITPAGGETSLDHYVVFIDPASSSDPVTELPTWSAAGTEVIDLYGAFSMAADYCGPHTENAGATADIYRLNAPCRAFHTDLFSRLSTAGFTVIVSQSFEILGSFLLESWRQKDYAGNYAETGWTPPSGLVSPTNFDAMNYLIGLYIEFFDLAGATVTDLIDRGGAPTTWSSVGAATVTDAVAGNHPFALFGHPASVASGGSIGSDRARVNAVAFDGTAGNRHVIRGWAREGTSGLVRLTIAHGGGNAALDYDFTTDVVGTITGGHTINSATAEVLSSNIVVLTLDITYTSTDTTVFLDFGPRSATVGQDVIMFGAQVLAYDASPPAVNFQLGEPWWWIGPFAAATLVPYLYDDATIALYLSETGNAIPADVAYVETIGDTLSSAQQDFLDWCGQKLGEAGQYIRDGVKATHSSAVSYLLIFTAQFAGTTNEVVQRINLPVAYWQSPEFDVLQLEDYDQLANNNFDYITQETFRIGNDVLGYANADIQYFSGWVAAAAVGWNWRNIDRALDIAIDTGPAEVFVWSRDQVWRDGWVREDSRKIFIGNHMCFLWHIVRTDGTEYRFTTHDADVVISGDGTYSPANAFLPGDIENFSDNNADRLEVLGVTSDEITEADLLGGLFENAEVTIAVADYENTDLGTKVLRYGRIGKVTEYPDSFRADCLGLSALLGQPVGRQFAAQCDAELGDSRCGVNLASYTVTGTVTSVSVLATIARPAASTSQGAVDFGTLSTNDSFSDSSRTEADDHFTHGKLTWTSGDNNGIEADVYLYTNDSFTGPTFFLLDAMPNAIAVGDTYSVYKGCNHTKAACQGFSNTANNRAFWYMPGNDLLIKYPNAKS